MGNNLDIVTNVEFVMNGEIALNTRGQLQSVLEELGHTVRPFGNNTHSSLPVIRKMPDLTKFMTTNLYKQTKANCGLSPDRKYPHDNWNLLQALRKRESGLAAPRYSSFTANQHRKIANLFIPNQKESRLLSLDSKVFVCKFSKDGSKLLTACQNGCLRIYDSSKGTYHLLNRLNCRDVTWSIIDADISPCGQYFTYSTWASSFMFMPINGTEDDCQWIDINCAYDRFAIFSIRYSPCGRKLVGSSNRSSIFIADIERRAATEIRTHRHPVVDINAVSYICDNDLNLIICGCDDGTMKLYDLRCSMRRRNVTKCVSNFYGHFDGVTYIDTRNDGYHVLSNSKDQSIKIWDIRQPSSARRGRQSPTDMPDWDYRWDAVPHIFYNPKKPLDSDSSIMTYRGHRVSKTLLRAKFSPAEQTGQRYIYTGCSTGRIIIYDVLTGKIREAIEGHKNVLRDLDWHPVRSEIVSGSWDSHIHLNTFKRNAVMSKSMLATKRRYNSQNSGLPLRRSKRLAERQDPSDMSTTGQVATSTQTEPEDEDLSFV